VNGVIRPPAERPAGSYEEALERVRAVMERDTAEIAPLGRTALYDTGSVAETAIVLLHGLTNHPGQFVNFAPLLRARGMNVFVPRVPYHGYANRMTTAIAALTAEQLVAAAYEAVDAAAGLGRSVAVMGISMGGLLSCYLAQYRSNVALSVPIAPDFGLLKLPRWATSLIGHVVRALPNAYLWWDPRIKAAQRPATAYPRFSTHALMQTVRIGDDVYAAARKHAPRAERIITVVNASDFAVNNGETGQVVARWKSLRSDGVKLVTFTDLPQNHDIIDPDNPLARTDLVYPRLIDILTQM
jgi:alpha-beta hydrolase superfamily lysophospholipase